MRFQEIARELIFKILVCLQKCKHADTTSDISRTVQLSDVSTPPRFGAGLEEVLMHVLSGLVNELRAMLLGLSKEEYLAAGLGH